MKKISSYFYSKTNTLLIAIVSILAIIGCKGDDPKGTQTLTLPTDLSVSVNKDSSNFGKVDIKATANNANFFTITFTENENEIVEKSTNGEATYTYKNPGTYNILIRAHSLDDEFIEKIEIVEFISNTPVREIGEPPLTGFTSPLTYDGYNLVWQDEFDGNELSTSNWNFEIGTGNNGWGNSELQYYLKENTEVKNGYLTITAKKQIYNSSMYTSSRITTEGKKSFKYGRVDIRAALPYGQGIWPALWMLGSNFKTTGWPQCGEIDIMEMVGGSIDQNGRGDNTTHGTAHWSDIDNKHAEFNGNTKISTGILYDEFHVFSIIWDKNGITWLFDNQSFHALDTQSNQFLEFQQTYFFVFNIAVGGKWPGNPNSETIFPQYMHIDYIRVFQ